MEGTLLRHATFFRAGHCRQLRWLADGRGWGTRKFQAMCLTAEHPSHGRILIDTGYSPHFLEATRPFPERLYRWLTPVTLHPLQDPARILAAMGCSRPDLIVLSHFHGDHIGGLRCFPEIPVAYLREGLDELQSLPPGDQVRHGFLAKLLPDDLESRARPFGLGEFTPGTGDWAEFEALDYFGDGSLRILHLPGHAPGHLGFVLNTEPRPILYVTDACWHLDFLRHPRDLPWLSRRFQHDYGASQETLRKLSRIDRDRYLTAACHCPETEPHAADLAH